MSLTDSRLWMVARKPRMTRRVGAGVRGGCEWGRGVRGRLLLVVSLAVVSGLTLSVGATASEAKTVWLCKPGLADNPCRVGLKTTVLSPSERELGLRNPTRAGRPKVDCFYVYPTVSDQPTPLASRAVDPVLRSVARHQAARFSHHCRVFAPVYRQITVSGAATLDRVSAEMRATAYADVRRAWRTYLKRHNRGRGVVLIGHSQGTHWLTKLLARRIEPWPKVRRRLVSALLIGPASAPLGTGAITVRKGKDKGGDLGRIRACRSARQLRCVVTYSTFGGPVPADAVFARTDEPGLEPLCTNPAALAGGSSPLRATYASEPFAPGTIALLAGLSRDRPLPKVSTPWLRYHRAYRGRCRSAGGAGALIVSAARGAPALNPVPLPSWGFHLDDINLAMGDLTALVRKQAKLFVNTRR